MALRPNVHQLKELFLRSRLVDELQMRSALARMEQWGGRLPGVLVDLGFCTDEQVTGTLAKALRLPVGHLGMVHHHGPALARLDAEFCEQHGVFPISLVDRVAQVAMVDPTEIDVVDLIASRMGARVQVQVASENEVQAAIAKHYRKQNPHPDHFRGHRPFADGLPLTHGEAELELDTEAPPEPAAPRSLSMDLLSRPPSANTMLDEFFDESAAPKATDGFSPAELERLEAARQNQDKTAAILRTLQALLTEKGYLR